MIKKVKPTKVLEELIYHKNRFGYYPTKIQLSIILDIGVKQLNNILKHLENKGEIKLVPRKYRGMKLKNDDT